ncbi:MAG TPA: glycosyltransferase [Candidatus Paceibacterota bacterium]|nr:glycosyltransferase [Candidatus Paceibacterota bacterium]
MKLAIVHDWIKDLAGAERVLIELHRVYPSSPIYTLFYRPGFVRQFLPDADIRPSFLQKIPFITRLYPLIALLMPVAVESFDLGEFDTVISSSVIFSKGLILKPSTRHICYCYSPSRQLWDRHAEYAAENNSWPARVAQHLLRLWDRPAADRVDQFVAISETVAARIKKYYRRDTIVIYPPANDLSNSVSTKNPSHAAVEFSRAGSRQKSADFCAPSRLPASERSRLEKILQRQQEYYLMAGRLYEYKNIGIAIEAFNKLGYPLVIVGDGPARKKLQQLANENIIFLGSVDDTTLANCYLSCRAFIMPQEEDFGLTSVEAMQFGKPVLALRRGGATETILEGVTGEFFDDPIPEGLADGIRRLNERYSAYERETIKLHAAKFSIESFRQKFLEIIA